MVQIAVLPVVDGSSRPGPFNGSATPITKRRPTQAQWPLQELLGLYMRQPLYQTVREFIMVKIIGGDFKKSGTVKLIRRRGEIETLILPTGIMKTKLYVPKNISILLFDRHSQMVLQLKLL